MTDWRTEIADHPALAGLSEKRRTQLLDEVATSMSAETIACNVGCLRQTVIAVRRFRDKFKARNRAKTERARKADGRVALPKGRRMLLSPEQAVAAWNNRGTKNLDAVAKDFGVSRTAVMNALEDAGVSWRTGRPKAKLEPRPCECGDPECLVMPREGETPNDFKLRRFGSRECRYRLMRKTQAGWRREPDCMLPLDSGDMLDRLLDVYGARNGEDDLPEVGQLGRLVTVRNEAGRIVA